MYGLRPGNGANGLLWASAVLALILWMLGRAFQLPGAFVHAFLAAAVLLLVLNFVRIRSVDKV